jgi:hypothetical protein
VVTQGFLKRYEGENEIVATTCSTSTKDDEVQITDVHETRCCFCQPHRDSCPYCRGYC